MHRTLVVVLVVLVAIVAAHPTLVDNRFDQLNRLEFDDDSNGPPTDHAKVARDIVHKAEYTAFGTNSALANLTGFPMVNIISVADSKRDSASTGHIYYLLTNLDFTAQDLLKNNHLTMLFSQEQNLDCSKRGTDPMEPTCAHVMISGRTVVMDKNSDEYQFGFAAFVDRHPRAHDWIAEHDFYLCTVDIASIIVQDWYGGPHHVPVDVYYQHSDDVPTLTESAIPPSVGHPPQQRRDKRHTIRIHVEPLTDDVVIEM